MKLSRSRYWFSTLVALALLALPSAAFAGPKIIDDGKGESDPTPADPGPETAPDGPANTPSDTGAAETDPGLDIRTHADRHGEEQRWVDPGAHRHDGFFMRIISAMDFWFLSETVNGVEASVTSLQIPILTGSFELGAAVTDNLIVNAEVVFAGGMVLDAEVDNVPFDGDGSIFGYGIGAGLNYYVMPMNLYVAATAGMAGVTFSDDGGGGGGSSEQGFYISGKVGKEWWISDNWGFGIAGRGLLMLLPDDDTEITNVGLGIALSATLN